MQRQMRYRGSSLLGIDIVTGADIYYTFLDGCFKTFLTPFLAGFYQIQYLNIVSMQQILSAFISYNKQNTK